MPHKTRIKEQSAKLATLSIFFGDADGGRERNTHKQISKVQYAVTPDIDTCVLLKIIMAGSLQIHNIVFMCFFDH